MIKAENLIILIDGSSYLYRAFHALPSLSNTQGEPTGAIYGVISMVKKLMTDYHPEYIAVVFDPKGKTKRNTIYSEYKASRPSMPSELGVQIKYIFEIIKAMGLPILVEEGIEADDVIGTLAVQATALGISTLISTGDKDMAQLVNDKVALINTMTNVIYDREGIIKKFGIPPEQIVDYLALIGDKVDNIPGIPHVGPKTACKWLIDFGSLEGIIKHAGQIKGKVGESLRHHLERLTLSKQLVTIDTNVSLAEQVIDLKRKEPNKPALINLYKHLEFKSWLSELLEQEVNNEDKKYAVIYDKKELSTWITTLKNCKCYAFDLEASHLDPMRADLIGMAFATEPQKAVYIPLAHHYESALKQLDVNVVLEKLKPLLLDPHKILVGENIKFALNLLLRYGVEVRNKLYDTTLESYIQNTSQAKHDKTTLSLKYLGKRALSYEDIGGKGAKQIACNMLDIEKVSQYAAGSASAVLELHQVMWENISKDSHLTNIINEIEMPLTRVLARMEYQGVLIDPSMLTAQSKELAAKIKILEEEAYNYVGHSFNLNSPKQLQTILYEKLQLPILSKTPTGQPSTSEAILQRLSHDFPLPKIILEHRSLSKIKATYTDSLPLQVNSRTGRIHTCYNQAVTLTGRLSSTDPNLQNIPARNEEGRRIRQAFIAPPGYRIVSADYSQVELRIMAHLSKDPGLLSAFEQKLDIHKATAAEVFNIPLDKVTPYQRRSAKVINFGLIYGMSSFGLAEQLNIERSLAQRYIDLYFKRYPNILAYMESTRLLAHKQGYVQTVKGRKIHLPEINASNIQRQRAAERAAINAPLQGTAAEVIKMAMIKIDRWLHTSHSKAKMIMQVHDELVFEVPEEDLENTKKQIKKIMVNILPMDVPLALDIGVGKNWDEAH